MSDLLNKRLILVLGKGGVGRSTVAASIAAACAAQGKRTLLFQANAKDRYGEFFGSSPVGPEIRELRKNLFAVNSTPAHALEEYGMMILKFRRVYKMVFENRITEGFINAIPGIEDYSLLGKVWYHTEESRKKKPVWDRVIFDMAASGHSLAMLRIPWSISSVVPEGPLTRDARAIQKLLSDPSQTALAMVTMAEDMPSNEAIELSTQLHQHLGISPHSLIVNQLYPERFPDGSMQKQVLDAVVKSTAISEVSAHASLFDSRQRLNHQYLQRLSSALDTPQIHLPRLFCPKLGPTQIDTLASAISAA